MEQPHHLALQPVAEIDRTLQQVIKSSLENGGHWLRFAARRCTYRAQIARSGTCRWLARKPAQALQRHIRLNGRWIDTGSGLLRRDFAQVRTEQLYGNLDPRPSHVFENGGDNGICSSPVE